MSGFSEMLIRLRKSEGLSQQELSEKLSVSRSAISMYESGKREPDYETLEEIADFFNVNMSTLLGKDEGAEIREYNEAILKRISQLCSRRGTSIAKIEKTLGYDAGTINGCRNEIRIAPLDKVVAVARCLNVPALALTGDIPEEEIKKEQPALSEKRQAALELIESLSDEQIDAILRLLGK